MPKTRAARLSDAAVLPLLAAAAGAVDALAFIALGHVFAGVMTGNLILMAIGLGSGSPGDAVYPLVALAGFAFAVVVAGRFCRTRGGARKDVAPVGDESGATWSRGVFVCLTVEVAFLAAVGVAWAAVGGHPDGDGRAALVSVLSLAMGLQTAAMFAAGPTGAPTTYFTGTLSSVLTDPSGGRPAGSRLAALLAGAVGAAALRTWAPAWAALPPPLCAAGALALALSAGSRDPDP
ncbi:DUF1275 domain-containing protein [Streptomyces sp. NBC_01023]|uniref:YoaK family protein n=1 Tax=Streptomyces sp. NBC_01023 TaxID=2903724 RepID=UPI00386548E0|nr:DUF1275 domain-containing protein [Streptomyces sp. NBC_01023]